MNTAPTSHASAPYDDLLHRLDVLRTPYREADIFLDIPEPCMKSFVLPFIKLVRNAALEREPHAIHRAFLILHMLPTAVLRRALRPDPR